MRCLVIEDDDALSMVLTDCLEDMGHIVSRAGTVAEAMKTLRTAKFDLLLIDYHLPDGNTILVTDYAAATCPGARLIMLTGAAVFPNGEASVFAPGVDWVLRKPVLIDDVRALVDYAAMDLARSNRVLSPASPAGTP